MNRYLTELIDVSKNHWVGLVDVKIKTNRMTVFISSLFFFFGSNWRSFYFFSRSLSLSLFSPLKFEVVF